MKTNTIDKIVLFVGIFAIAGLMQAADTAIREPKPPATVLKSEYDALIVERDNLRKQLNDAQGAANVYRAQRNELASNLLDLNAQIGALQAENKRLSAVPAK